MDKRRLLITYKAGLAALVLGAIITQLVHNAQLPGFSPVNFFSYFTILSSAFGALTFLASAYYLMRGTPPDALGYLRGAATLYMLVTGIVYSLLLANTGHQFLPWVSDVLHYLFPVVILLDWVLDQPPHRPKLSKSLLWLAFPLVYVAYTLLHGPVAHWYPYPFIDVGRYGYARVTVSCVEIAIGVLALILIVARLPWLGRWRHAPEP